MSGMFRIALELSIPKIRFNIMLSLPVKKYGKFKFDGLTTLVIRYSAVLSFTKCIKKTKP